MSLADGAPLEPEKTYIVYDGECPFCSAYVKLVRLRQAVGDVVMLNARDGGALVDYLLSRKIDLDEGMVLVHENRIYHGEDCINVMALLSTRSGLFNKLNYLLFKNRHVAAVLYPVLRAGRNLIIRLLGKSKLSPSGT